MIRARRGISPAALTSRSVFPRYFHRISRFQASHPHPRGRYGVLPARHPLTLARLHGALLSPRNYAKTFKRISAGNSAAHEDASVVLGFRAANKGQGGATSRAEPRHDAASHYILLMLRQDSDPQTGREKRRRAVRIAGVENGSKFVDKQNYSSFSGRNNFLGIYPGDTRP